MDGLAAGNECLKQLQRELSVEDVERIMADTEDAIAYQQVSRIR
jgi:charged multivesicular body protein 6